MHAPTLRYPGTDILTRELGQVLAPHQGERGITVTVRRPNPQLSSLASELVTCQLDDGSEVQVFCKYSGSDFDSRHGHRGGASYEADVYRQVLEPFGVPAPRYLGWWSASVDGELLSCLVLQALNPVRLINKQPAPHNSVLKVAGAIGVFHAAAARAGEGRWPSFLRRYDAEYYSGWIRRTAEYARSRSTDSSWLPRVCEWAMMAMQALLSTQQTIVHGEMYSNNLLSIDGEIYLLDWQSAAIAAGEIDLAMLCEGWPQSMVEQCVAAYQAARWPDGRPADFENVFEAARLYLAFRWLGDKPEWTQGPTADWRFALLREAAKRCGLMAGQA